MAEFQVEARSLSAINFLAANPPQYPVNPTEEPREPLVLYISRVPGSQDVILSPFKPQKKNVTGDDVANSLYYVHLNDPLTDHAVAEEDPSRACVENRPPILRKPLPSATQVPPALQTHASEGDVLRQRLGQPAASAQKENLLVPDEARAANGSSDMREPALPPRPAECFAQPPIVRKPLGPRKMGTNSRLRDGEESSNPVEDAPPPVLPPRRYPGDSQPPSPTRRRDAHGSFGPSTSKRNDASFAPFKISVIRRDPASGQQWNVGRVASLQSTAGLEGMEGEPLATKPRQGRPNIHIHLETSGYAKFRGMPSRRSLEAFRPGSSSSLPQTVSDGHDGPGAHAAAMGSHRPLAIEEGFTRKVTMNYTKSIATNVKDIFKRRPASRDQKSASPDPVDLPLPDQPYVHHGRQGSGNSFGSMESGESSSPSKRPPHARSDSEATITTAGPGLKARGYAFYSPWDGRCEFRTGRAGRSLTCRHITAGGRDAYNPLVARDRGRKGQGRSRQGSLSAVLGNSVESAPVSELRFNLPNADLFRKQQNGQGDDARHPLYGRLDKLLRLDTWHDDDWNSSDEEPDEEAAAFYMGLGQEKAGGGNRGKRAKLGKLIVYDEGQKMLDLVVAANIGIWWVAWEKSA